MLLTHPFCFRRWLLFVALWLVISPAAWADDAAPPVPSAPYDYAEPKLITGTVYETGSEQKKILYTFQRTATRTNDTVYAERRFLRPDGFVAAVENIVYKSGRLTSFQMKEFQANVSGTIDIAPDPKNPTQQNICIGYDKGLTPQKGEPKKLPPDIVIDDTVYPFLLAHWDKLMKGDSVKFRFVALEWERTFMFRFVKTGETTMHGHTHVQIKMEPTNLLVAPMVNPLFFMMEKDGDHHLVSYIGRTTPRVQKGKTWKYLDAETVFDWK